MKIPLTKDCPCGTYSSVKGANSSSTQDCPCGTFALVGRLPLWDVLKCQGSQFKQHTGLPLWDVCPCGTFALVGRTQWGWWWVGIVGHRWTWVIPNRLRESTYTKDKELLGDAYCDLNQIKTKLPDFHPPLLFGLSSFTSSIQFLLCFLVCPVSHPQLLLGAILARQAPSAKARFSGDCGFETRQKQPTHVKQFIFGEPYIYM